MKVSVVMGLYNCEKTLRTSLDSLVKQTFQDFDVILCDDGSTDGTLRLAEEYVKRFPDSYHLLVNSSNKGLAFSLNKCLIFAKGDYIARMDADDYSLPDRFKQQVAFLDNHPQYDFVGSSVDLFDEAGTWGIRRMPEKPQKRDFLFVSPFVHPTLMIRESALSAVERYDTSKKMLRAEDYDLFMRLYANGYTGYNIQDCLVQFREDSAARKRRSYRLRLDEAKVRLAGFKQLKLLPEGYPYVIKPLIVGLIPQSILRMIKRQKIKI